MSFSAKYFATYFVRCCRTVYEQLLAVHRSHVRLDVTSSLSCSSMNLRGQKHHFDVNSMRGVLCLSRLLFNRTFRSAKLSSFSDNAARIQVPSLVCGIHVENRGLPLTTLAFSRGGSTNRPYRDDSDPSRGFPNGDDDYDRQPLRLMEFREIVWPHPWKLIRNYLFSLLIRSYFDDKFSIDGFLSGAEQAISVIAGFISRGQFDELQGLVTEEAIQEVKRHYMRLNQRQRDFVAVNPKDFFSEFVFEIGMIFNDDTAQRFVEITTVFQGFHGLDELKANKVSNLMAEMQRSPDQMYICNYRFIREFTKGKEYDWTVNKLNHFLPSEHAANR